ncbi:hypothetical protein PAECIP111892_00172 [Paenibacillus auburnensis]|uniref:BRCT domain-containing protein n=1 Tax=Paenibacillus auburnensis TaxID=2905649 RepID=A0ABN8FVA5_9BACL|nr:hypothetical protein PAECIP111892_00172 [Paenibacillus auburnensis]
MYLFSDIITNITSGVVKKRIGRTVWVSTGVSIRQPALHIHIVDTGSTDETKAIAESFGAVIYDFTWIDDFSAARSYCL